MSAIDGNVDTVPQTQRVCDKNAKWRQMGYFSRGLSKVLWYGKYFIVLQGADAI